MEEEPLGKYYVPKILAVKTLSSPFLPRQEKIISQSGVVVLLEPKKFLGFNRLKKQKPFIAGRNIVIYRDCKKKQKTTTTCGQEYRNL